MQRFQPYGAGFELRDLRQRVKRGVREQVGGGLSDDIQRRPSQPLLTGLQGTQDVHYPMRGTTVLLNGCAHERHPEDGDHGV